MRPLGRVEVLAVDEEMKWMVQMRKKWMKFFKGEAIVCGEVLELEWYLKVPKLCYLYYTIRVWNRSRKAPELKLKSNELFNWNSLSICKCRSCMCKFIISCCFPIDNWVMVVYFYREANATCKDSWQRAQLIKFLFSAPDQLVSCHFLARILAKHLKCPLDSTETQSFNF